MIFQNSPTFKTKTVFSILKISVIFLAIIISFFGNFNQSFAVEIFGVPIPGLPKVEVNGKDVLSVTPTTIGTGLLSVLLDGVSMIAEFIFYLFGAISGAILTLGGYLLDLGIKLNQAIMESEMVTNGYPITLSIVNLFFILAIIVIAFATILRYEGYGIKKLLTKLIIAAVLINFSLTLAGLVLDFTGVFSNFFIYQATSGEATSFSENLVGYLQPQTHLLKTYTRTDINIEGLLGLSEAMINLLIKTFMTALFTIIMAIVILSIAFMIFIRYIALVILIVLMPLAWMMWIIPETTNLSRKWWSEFIKWNFFLPAVTFFLYLSMLISFSPAKDTTVTDYLPDQMGITLQDFGNMIIALGLLVGGLMAAQKFGIYGANAAMAYVTKIKNGAVGVAGKIGKVAAKGAAAPVTIPAGRITTKLVNSNAWKGTADAFSKIPGLRGMARGMYNLKESKQEEIIKKAKEISGSPNAIMTEAASFTLDPAIKARRAIKLAQEGLLERFKEKHGEKKMDDLLEAAKSTDTSKEILKYRLDLAEKLGLEDKLEAVVSKMSPEEVSKLSPENFASGAVVSQLEKRHYSSLFKKASIQKLKKLAIGIEKAAKIKKDDAGFNSLLNNTILVDPVMQRIAKETDFKKELGISEKEEYESILKSKVSEIEEKIEEEKRKKQEGRAEKKSERQEKEQETQEREREKREESEKGKVKIYSKYTPIPKKPTT